MADREGIARRHGISHLAHKLVGETAEELEADAAAKASLIQLLSPRDMNVEQPEPAEPEVEGLPPKDKPISEYTDEERAATHANLDRTMRMQGKREERERLEQEARIEAETTRTDDQRLGDGIAAQTAPAAKREWAAAFVRSVHPDDGDEQ